LTLTKLVEIKRLCWRRFSTTNNRVGL